MTIDRQSPMPLYEQVASLLSSQISSGAFSPGARLPTEAELGAVFEVSRVTVRLALERLAKAGVIERHRGKGTYVTGVSMRHQLDGVRSFHESLKLMGMAASMRILELSVIKTPIGCVVQAPMQPCVLLRRLHLVDDEPIALACSYLPATIAGISVEEATRRTTYSILHDMIGKEISRAELAIGTMAADSDSALCLHVAPRAPLLVLERVSFFSDDICAEQSKFFIRSERYRFILQRNIGARL